LQESHPSLLILSLVGWLFFFLRQADKRFVIFDLAQNEKLVAGGNLRFCISRSAPQYHE
jgi:hypothetical protein